jgi:hypothetical protein
MATRELTSKPRKNGRASTERGLGATQRQRRQKTGAVEHVYGVPVPKGLHEAIEIERGNLSRAESLLGCLAISLEYETDSVTAPYYPDVAQIARDLVRQSLNGLDSLTLQQRLLRNKVKEETDLPSADASGSVPSEADSSIRSVYPYGLTADHVAVVTPGSWKPHFAVQPLRAGAPTLAR